MKKIVVLTLVLAILLSHVIVFAQSSITVVIDGVEVLFSDAAPFVDENSRTLVPLRAIGEAMGLTVIWDANQRTATFTKNYTWEDSPLYQDYDGDGENDGYLGYEKMIFTIDDNKALYDEGWYDKGTSPGINAPTSGGIAEISMDTAAIIKDSRTYAPIRYLAETFRYDVYWDGETKTVILNNIYTAEQLGVQIEQVACWKDMQAWMLTVNEESQIRSIDIFEVLIKGKETQYSILSDEEQSTIYEVGEKFGEYMSGFTVENELTLNLYNSCSVKFLVRMEDGTTKFGHADLGFYYDGGQGGYI